MDFEGNILPGMEEYADISKQLANDMLKTMV
jgi:hypothetical protein